MSDAEYKPEFDSVWPRKRGAFGFNEWNTDFRRFSELLNSVAGETWWIEDMALKYLNVRMDTRDNSFLVFIDGSERIDPQRVANAIDRYRETYLEGSK